jgi:osmotically-inducible protein OsmY
MTMTLANRCAAGILSAFLALTAAGCAHDQSWGQKFEDAALTTKVKAALVGDPDVSGLAIKVDTLRGQVQLSGFVKSQQQAQRAVNLAERVDGVKDVINKISVQP